jgi:integrase
MTLGKHGPYQKRPLTVKAVDKLITKYLILSKIKKRITPHSFRATYITQRGDKDLASLLTLSGHADLKGLTPYLRAKHKKIEEAAFSRSYA